MHVQVPVEGWLTALVALPAGAGLKSVNNPSILREGKQVWTQAGRNPAQLITDFRFNDFEEAPSHLSFDGKRAWYRQQFFRFIDRTYLEQYAAFVDQVEAENEYTATSTWTDLVRTHHLLENNRAVLSVWNDEFRGRTVVAPDGGMGTIPGHCRLVIVNGPVSNDIHPDLLRLAVLEDAIVGYHPYTRYWRKQRYVDDWQDDSGRWERMEQAAGVRPRWAFTECGPYLDVDGGWRRADVLDGDADLLVKAMSDWWAQVVQTRAYNEGRLMGWTGHWFTVGKTKWPFYELETPELLALAQVARAVWAPGTESDEMDREKVAHHARAILAEATGQWWLAWPEGVYTAARKLAVPNKVIPFYTAGGGLFVPSQSRNVTYTMDVFERRGDLLRVTTNVPAGSYAPREPWWVRASDVSAA